MKRLPMAASPGCQVIDYLLRSNERFVKKHHQGIRPVISPRVIVIATPSRRIRMSITLLTTFVGNGHVSQVGQVVVWFHACYYVVVHVGEMVNTFYRDSAIHYWRFITTTRKTRHIVLRHDVTASHVAPVNSTTLSHYYDVGQAPPGKSSRLPNS